MFREDLLAGRVAVVTGAGTGIGVGIVEALAEAGASVVAAYHGNAAGAEALAARIGAPDRLLATRCDCMTMQRRPILRASSSAADRWRRSC